MRTCRPWVSLLFMTVAVAGDGPPMGRTEWRQALDRRVDRLIEELGADDVDTRERASADLLPLADLLIDRLRGVLASTDDAERRARMEALIDAAPGLAREAETLEQLLRAGRVSAEWDPSSLPWTTAHLASRRVLQMDLADPSIAGRIRERFPSAVRPPMLAEALVLRMEDRSPFVAAGACRMLGLLEVREAIPMLRDWLSHPLRWVAVAAVEALFSFPDPDLAPLLIDDSALHVTSDRDRAVAEVRRAAWLVEVRRRRGWVNVASVLASDPRWDASLSLDVPRFHAERSDETADPRSPQLPGPSDVGPPDGPYDPEIDSGPLDAMEEQPSDESYYPGPR